MITPIEKTYDRLMLRENLELNCEGEQKLQFQNWIPIFATFSAVKWEIQ